MFGCYFEPKNSILINLNGFHVLFNLYHLESVLCLIMTKFLHQIHTIKTIIIILFFVCFIKNQMLFLNQIYNDYNFGIFFNVSFDNFGFNSPVEIYNRKIYYYGVCYKWYDTQLQWNKKHNNHEIKNILFHSTKPNIIINQNKIAKDNYNCNCYLAFIMILAIFCNKLVILIINFVYTG